MKKQEIYVLQTSKPEEKEILETVCTDVGINDEELLKIKDIKDIMVRVCNSRGGVGLAANQLGVLKRFFLIKDDNGGKLCINPKILNKEGIKINLEGCLSRLLQSGIHTKRYNKVQVEYTNLDKEVVVEWLKGKEAIVFQHELDHLNGIIV